MEYQKPEMEMVIIVAEDVIRTSLPKGDIGWGTDDEF